MSAAFVIDSSVAMTWLFKDEATPLTVGILSRLEADTALVPALWYLELANVMAMAERARRVAASQIAEFIGEVARLDIEVDAEGPERAFGRLLPLCRAHRLTSYDAVYLDLALRRQLPLATLDEPLRKAARKLGVGLLGR
jgi:predicted nucleic acid-binding protein